MSAFYHLFDSSGMKKFPVKKKIQILKHLLLKLWTLWKSSIYIHIYMFIYLYIYVCMYMCIKVYGLYYLIDSINLFPTVIMGEYKPYGVICLTRISGKIILSNSSFSACFSSGTVLCCMYIYVYLYHLYLHPYLSISIPISISCDFCFSTSGEIFHFFLVFLLLSLSMLLSSWWHSHVLASRVISCYYSFCFPRVWFLLSVTACRVFFYFVVFFLNSISELHVFFCPKSLSF